MYLEPVAIATARELINGARPSLALVTPFALYSHQPYMADPIEQPVTPPPRASTLPDVQGTPEHVKQFEINRLRGTKPLEV